MTPEDAFARDIWWLLQALKKEALATPRKFEFHLFERDDAPSVAAQRNLLKKLHLWAVARGEPMKDRHGQPNDFNFVVQIDPERFDQLYHFFENGVALGVPGAELYNLANVLMDLSWNLILKPDPRSFDAWEIMKGRRKPVKNSASGKTKPTSPVTPGTRWQQVAIKMKDLYAAEIFIDDKLFKLMDVADMGFVRSRTKDKTPDRQWEFLRLLSVMLNFKHKKNDDEEFEKLLQNPTIENMANALSDGKHRVTKDATMKTKEKLSGHLKQLFGIRDNPFHPYDDYGYYQPRFKLMPMPELRRDQPWSTGIPYDDLLKHENTDADTEALM